MFPMLSGLFVKGDNGWVVLAHKTISVPLTKTEGPESPMLHTKFRGNRSTCSGEVFEGFLPYIGIAAIFVM